MMTPWQITIDCPDPGRPAGFWGYAVEYDLAPPPDGYASWEEWAAALDVPGGASIVGPAPVGGGRFVRTDRRAERPAGSRRDGRPRGNEFCVV